ncbi:hypothetical protein LOTGIDRAFT_170286 [Lottia gigantea]|uniref:Ionotropic glutamate receptor L-glutamate and glycine-binding domain-containing protein n=1 Tax=Lottia gigantea TaxID=225164 RepID=V4B1L8_LOTGI|nr:hypothetical protein LOTGIDRAFT_170286 [Lottia gigantea]ESO82139.1 hypothetical protein LOTGIDRAFT_170286 [Lottia gigantea]
MLMDDALSLCLGQNSGFMTTRYDLTNSSHANMKDILINEYDNVRSNVNTLLVLGQKTAELLDVFNRSKWPFNHYIHYATNSKWIIIDKDKNFTKSLDTLKQMNVLVIGHHGSCVHLYCPINGTELDLRCMDMADYQNISIGDLQTAPCDERDFFPNLKNKLSRLHLNIGVIESVSFFEIHVDGNNVTAYTGIIPLLVKILAYELNFTYSFVLPADRSWGIKENGEWNGMIKDLIEHRTNVIAADLTVTSERFEVVDFVFPAIMIQDLGILYRKGIQGQESDWIRVFGPLDPSVYAVTFSCLIVVGVLLLVLDRDQKSNTFLMHIKRLMNVEYVSSVMLSVIGVVLLQGNGLRPRTASSKMLAATFWMFCIVITGTYIGNLTARMTISVVSKPFTNLEGLVASKDWTWGVGGEFTADMIRLHQEVTMKKVWNGLVNLNRTVPGVLDFNNTFQFSRILDPSLKYAYIVLDAKYFVNNRMDCAFELSDSVLSGLSIALAVNKNSSLRAEFEKVMWGLFNNGILDKIHDDHYRDNRPLSCLKPTPRKTVQANDLLGAVLVVIFGVGLAFIVLLLEWIPRFCKSCRKDDNRH